MYSSIFCRAIILIFLCVLQSASFQDQDLGCSSRDHITGFTRKVEGGKKTINSKCSPYVPPVTEEPACHVGIAFKCTDDWEGCDDPNAWIGGFQVFDVDGNAEVYVPYCCVSGRVKVDQPKCREVKLVDKPNQSVEYVSSSSRLFSKFRCKYFKSDDQKSVKYMTIAVQECTYNISSDNHRSAADSTTAVSPTTPGLDASVCFNRLISKITSTQSLDLVEENTQVIDTPSVNSESECASRCLHSDTRFGSRCESYKYTATADNSTQTCTLRKHFAKEGNVRWIQEKLFIAYGNRRDVCDSIKRR